MCRFVAYRGPETSLSPLVYGGTHPLVEQAWAPRELLSGHTNADGYGVVWYHEGEPVRLARAEPIWYDTDLQRLLETVRTTTAVASLRNATTGMPIGVGASAPLTLDRWSFTLNGYVRGFHRCFKRGFHRRIPDDLYARMRNGNDTETLFMLAIREIRDGADPAEALLRVVELVRDALGSSKEEHAAQLNMVLSDGQVLAVSRTSSEEATNTLYLARSPERFPDGTVLASEALDPDPAWSPVEAQTVVRVLGDGSTEVLPASL